MTAPRLAVIVSGFPRRSETFAVAELNALDRRGLLAAVFSTKPGEDGPCQPAAESLRGRVRLLTGATAAALAADAAHHLEATAISGVHAYFAHTPAAVASDLASALQVPFGFSVHARDARKAARPELHERARRAACVVACNGDVAREFDGSGAHVTLVPHGVDLQRFAPRPRATADEFRMLAVGRLVEKKGFHLLVDAAARLTLRWRLRIVGDGPERGRLAARVRDAGIGDRVTFCGTATHDTLPLEYLGADAVVVPSIRDASGDRDGLPNVVLEAMASGTPVVATDAGAIASVVRDADNGLLVQAGDAAALRRALTALAADADLRRRLAARGRATVERDFDSERCTAHFAAILGAAYA
jgi:glycosyltransferase involved in cell wall biosynthesis